MVGDVEEAFATRMATGYVSPTGGGKRVRFSVFQGGRETKVDEVEMDNQ